jgi:hypothetical protein
MLDATSLSEEELGLLFGPASHGAGSSACTRGRNPRTAARKPPSRGARVSTAKKTAIAAPLSTNTPFGAVVPARCGYRTGKCQNLQAIKRNGRLHKLCEFHRERANLNQKKLDRKKRMQRSERVAKSSSSCESVASSEDDDASTSRSPRTVEAAATSSVFARSEPKTAKSELDTELFLPTSLHEAPLALGCEERAIFCDLMTFDMHSHRPPPPTVRRHTRPRHYCSGTV